MSLQAILEGVNARLRFNANAHRYYLDDKPIAGVTTVIRAKSAPGLEKWKVRVERSACAKFAFATQMPAIESEAEFVAWFLEASGKLYEHEKQSAAAADLGSQVHALVEEHLKERLGIPFTLMTPVTDQARACFNDSWLPWEKDSGLEPLAIECRVFNEEHWYSGTIDLVANVEGVGTVFDWKGKGTDQVKKLYAEPVLQSMAYRKALESLTGQKWAGRVVNFPREGGGSVVVHEINGNGNWTEDDAFDAFLACLKLYRFDAAFNRK